MRSTGVGEKVVDTYLYKSENKRCISSLGDNENRASETTVEESD